MKIYFKKGWNKDKPKRWYVFSGDCVNIFNNNDIEPTYFNSSHSSWVFASELRKMGFYPSKDTSVDPFKYSRNASHRLYLYFKNHADEAEFILKSSEGFEI